MKTGGALVGAAIAMVCGALSVPAAAQTTVGAGSSGNTFPFSSPAATGVTRYQEVYNAAAFGQPITFNRISFTVARAGRTYGTATYQISFSTTTFSSTTLTNNLNANVTGAQSAFGTFTVSGTPGATLNFTGNAFTFDPAQGNLLMDIRISDAQANNVGSTSFRSDSTGTTIARAYDQNGTGFAESGALQTTFSMAAAPEPSTWLMMILGFGVVGYAMRRRKVSFGSAPVARLTAAR